MNNTTLPRDFLEEMKNLLGDEYEAFIDSYKNNRTYGLKVNIHKTAVDDFKNICPFEISPIEFSNNAFYYNEDTKPSKSPLYYSGLYYIQDPAATIPAAFLPIEKDDFVLDMCAAPGGKATSLGAKLNGTGLIVANDISNKRAKILMENMEKAGIINSCILSMDPQNFPKEFNCLFDKIMLDAPCSGEGMFRKDESLALDWTKEKSIKLSLLQEDLLEKAYTYLKPGGYLMYSTCTFNTRENEHIILKALENHSDLHTCPLDIPGAIDGFYVNGKAIKNTYHIFPHKVKAEGHFLCLLKKDGESKKSSLIPKKYGTIQKETLSYIKDFLNEIGLNALGGEEIDFNRFVEIKDKIYYLPKNFVNIKKLNYVRNGLFFGDKKKNRFEPSQQLALSILKDEATATIDLKLDDKNLLDFIKGNTINVSTELKKGYYLITCMGYSIGFGKNVNGIIKNKIPTGFRGI